MLSMLRETRAESGGLCGKSAGGQAGDEVGDRLTSLVTVRLRRRCGLVRP
jgi:hypothetical protein